MNIAIMFWTIPAASWTYLVLELDARWFSVGVLGMFRKSNLPYQTTNFHESKTYSWNLSRHRPFLGHCLNFIPPENVRKSEVQIFSGVIEMEHWPEMHQSISVFQKLIKLQLYETFFMLETKHVNVMKMSNVYDWSFSEKIVKAFSC